MNVGGSRPDARSQYPIPINRKSVIGAVLVVALISFELFNFDTTKYALSNLLGEKNFVGVRWASILAVAFCAIDFAGLAHLLTPEQGRDEPREIWYLMGAWLLGATMNAMMTWWAVSLTLLEHSLGNEVLSREQLLQVVPIFVAMLVWLTRILFIGALSVAGENMLRDRKPTVIKKERAFAPPVAVRQQQGRPQPVKRPVRAAAVPASRPRPPLPPQTNRPQSYE